MSSSAYRFQFNGKEVDDEVAGNGNSYDYGFRIYNPRIAKFLSVDPLFQTYPWLTPYQFAGNTPIMADDLDGLEQRLRFVFNENGKTIIRTYNAKDFKYRQWQNMTKSYFLHYGNSDDGWESGYNEYKTLGGGGYGPGYGTLTVNSTGNIVRITYDPTQLVDNSPQLPTTAESLRMGVEAWYAIFISGENPWGDGEIEGLKEAHESIVEFVGLTLGSIGGEILLGRLATLGRASKVDDVLKVSDDVVRAAKNNPYLNMSRKEVLKSKDKYTKLLKEHQTKLDDFMKDPIGNSSDDWLKVATKDNPSKEELYRRAVSRGTGSLTKQINKHKGELKKINEALSY